MDFVCVFRGRNRAVEVAEAVPLQRGVRRGALLKSRTLANIDYSKL